MSDETPDKTALGDDQSILERVHNYVQNGKKFQGNDKHWKGLVTLNKEQAFTVYDTKNRENITRYIPAKDATEIDIIVLQQLVRIATQEGCPDKRVDWNATGKPRKKNPLKITVSQQGVDMKSPDAYNKLLRIPTP